MLAFSGRASIEKLPLCRAVYAATLARIVALSQMLRGEMRSNGIRIQALCPGVVATECHERQGLDLSKVPRMSAEDVVTASLPGLDLGEVVCAPGVERPDLHGDIVTFGFEANAWSYGDGVLTAAGLRGSRRAELIEAPGAFNQTKDDVTRLFRNS